MVLKNGSNLNIKVTFNDPMGHISFEIISKKNAFKCNVSIHRVLLKLVINECARKN